MVRDTYRRRDARSRIDGRRPYTLCDKLKVIANADEIIQAARGWICEASRHKRKDDIVEFARGFVIYKVGNKVENNGYAADVLVAIRKYGAAVLYDLVGIYSKKYQKPMLLWRAKAAPNVGMKPLIQKVYHARPTMSTT